MHGYGLAMVPALSLCFFSVSSHMKQPRGVKSIYQGKLSDIVLTRIRRAPL
jgi:hypothetical protein